VLDLGHDSRDVLGKGCGSASQVAFSVVGSRVAAATDAGVVVGRRCLHGVPTAGPLAWLGSSDLVIAREAPRPMLARIAAGPARAGATRSACLRGAGDALATWAAPNGLAVGIGSGTGVELRALAKSSGWGDCPALRGTLLLDLPRARHVTSLDVR
jgi:hypothetical protein